MLDQFWDMCRVTNTCTCIGSVSSHFASGFMLLRLIVFSRYFTTFVKQVLGRSVCKYIANHCVILDFRREVDENCSLLGCYSASSGLALKVRPTGCPESPISY